MTTYQVIDTKDGATKFSSATIAGCRREIERLFINSQGASFLPNGSPICRWKVVETESGKQVLYG